MFVYSSDGRSVEVIDSKVQLSRTQLTDVSLSYNTILIASSDCRVGSNSDKYAMHKSINNVVTSDALNSW